MTLEEAKKYKQEVNEVCDYKKNQWFIHYFIVNYYNKLFFYFIF